MQALGQLDPTLLAQHAPAVAARLEDSDEAVQAQALQTLLALEPATFMLHACDVFPRLEGYAEWEVRCAALEKLGMLEPATIAQHAGPDVARLQDNAGLVRRAALHTLDKLQPATLVRHADAVVAVLEDPVRHVRQAAFDTLSALPCYVTRGIDLTSKALRSRLLGRAAWYRCRLRLRCWRGLALYWYALPYRPSGPGHARDVEAWNLMSGNRDQSSSQATSTSTRETKRQKKARGAQAVGGSSTSMATSTSTRETRGQKKARGAQAVGGSS